MSDAINWPPGAQEAVASAILRAEIDAHTWSCDAYADAALAALAPFVARIKAAAFQRGAEAMREKAAAVADEGDMAERDYERGGWQDARAAVIADAIRDLPIPEEKP